MSILIKKHPATDDEQVLGLIHFGNMLSTDDVADEIAATAPQSETQIRTEMFNGPEVQSFSVSTSEMIEVFRRLGQPYIQEDSPVDAIQYALYAINNSRAVRSLIGLADGANHYVIDYDNGEVKPVTRGSKQPQIRLSFPSSQQGPVDPRSTGPETGP